MEHTNKALGRRLTAIRENRAARRTLQHELASYTSQSELNDLQRNLEQEQRMQQMFNQQQQQLFPSFPATP